MFRKSDLGTCTSREVRFTPLSAAFLAEIPRIGKITARQTMFFGAILL
jgi:hypothetical protein